MSINQKIANIQKGIGKMKKDTKGFNYKFYDINQLLEKLQPLLEKEKLVLTQPLGISDGKTLLRTVISDLESDEVIQSEIFLPESVKPQDMGSAQTYYRRYSIVSLLALQAEDDDAKSSNYQAGDSSSKKVPYVKVADQEKARAETQKAKDNGGIPF